MRSFVKFTSGMNKSFFWKIESSWVLSLLFSLILILRSLLKWRILLHSSLKISNLEGDVFNHLFPYSILSFKSFYFHVFILVHVLIFSSTKWYHVSMEFLLRQLLYSLGEFHFHLLFGLVQILKTFKALHQQIIGQGY